MTELPSLHLDETAGLAPQAAALQPATGAEASWTVTTVPPRAARVVLPKKLDSLTSLRFFAALLVVVAHCNGRLYLPAFFAHPFQLQQSVGFFFVLSGFILAYVHPSLHGGSGSARFFRARFARVWPAHAFAFLLFLLAIGWNGYCSWYVAIANLAMVHAWVPMHAVYAPFNTASWSISTEFGFYLFFPLLIRKFDRRWPLYLLFSFALLCGLIALCNHLNLTYLDSDPRPDRGHYVHVDDIIYFNPLARLFEFVLGMCMALAFRRLAGWYRRNLLVGTLIEIAAIALVVASMYASNDWSRSQRISWIGLGGRLWLRQGGIPAVPFALLILTMAFHAGAFSRALRASVFVLLGEISFSVYLIHGILIQYYLDHPASLAKYPSWLAFVMLLMLLLLMSHLVWRWIENPCRRWIAGSGRTRRPQMPSAEPAGGGQTASKTRIAHPARLLLIGEPAVLVMLLAPVIYASSFRTTVTPITSQGAAELATAGNAGVSDVKFGEQFTLLSAKLDRLPQGLELTFAWRSEVAQKLKYAVALHLLDDATGLIGDADYLQDANRWNAPKGFIWKDTIVVPKNKAGEVTMIGLGIYDLETKQSMPIDAGRRDFANRRLLLQIPRGPAHSGVGVLDIVSRNFIAGWAWYPNLPDQPATVEIYDGQTRLAETSADRFRQDLKDAGLGNGRHVFIVATSALNDGKRHYIRAKLKDGASLVVNGGPENIDPLLIASQADPRTP